MSERGRKLDEIDRRTRALLERNRAEIESMKDGVYEDSSEEPEEIGDPKAELAQIRADKEHPFNNPKASPEEHQQAVDYVNELIARTLRS